jgi:hypothetical protein
MSETLTLKAAGPAKAVRTTERDGVDVETRVTTEVDASMQVDAEWFLETEHANVYKNGAYLDRRSVADLVADAAGDDGTTYVVSDVEEWQLELAGTVHEWLSVVIPAAKRRVTVGGSDKIANLACHVLDDLSEHAVSNRPQLALLDLLEDHDPTDFQRERVLQAVSERSHEPAQSAEAVADD